MNLRFRRIAVVNRGEAAVRLIRAVHELEAEEPVGLRTIALYTDPDAHALFVREADEAYRLGSASFVDPRDGERKNRYLDVETIVQALRATASEAVWVGWGFVAEHASFAERCRELGVTFIGPRPEVMRELGDKIGSKRLAEKAGVPVAPWSGGPVASLDEARTSAASLGLPLMVKASAGGGGRGIRRVATDDELAPAFESARSEALKAFGDETVFLERQIQAARHVEVQVIADEHGNTWALGVRDCSIQRRNQKVLEETPSPALDPDQHRAVCDAAVRLVAQAGYHGAGTVEFLYDPTERRLSFMEVNARLQVEHPVTEEVTGVDLVKLQIHVAQGGRLEGEPPTPRGHAIEVRVNAEDPEREFAPSPGEIALLRMPGGRGVRVDAGVAEGDRIPAEFDSMIAKVIASGRDRNEALARLERAMGEMRLAVRGGASNRGFLLGLLRRPEVRRGEPDNAWLDELSERRAHLPPDRGAEALVAGAIEAWETAFEGDLREFLSTAARGRPRVRHEVGRAIELRYRGTTYTLAVHRLGRQRYRIRVGGHEIVATIEPVAPLERRLQIGDARCRVVSFTDGLDQIVEIDGITHRLSRDDAGIVRAPAPAVVLALPRAVGEEVGAGEVVAVLEAMKTEMRVFAPCAGRVKEVAAAVHEQVDTGAPLLILETGDTDVEQPGTTPVDFGEAAAQLPATSDPQREALRALEELEQLMLGFDVDPAASDRLVEAWRTACDALPGDDPEVSRAEDAVLAAFSEGCALFRGRGGEESSSEEYLHSFLRAPDAAGTGLPESFLDKLRRALAQYGVESLEPGRPLEEALLWICRAHGRMDAQASVVLRLLERRLDRPERLASDADPEHRALLDRIVDATRSSHPAVCDLARQVRYRTFERRRFEDMRRQAYAEAERHISALEAADSVEPHLTALVDCREPLVNLLTARMPQASGEMRQWMLEALTRRYYQIRTVDWLGTRQHASRSLCEADYRHEGDRIHVIATCGALSEFDALLADLRQLVAGLPTDCDLMIDAYLWRDDAHDDPDVIVERIREAADAAALPRRLRRLVVALGALGDDGPATSMQHYTLRPDAGGQLAEERVYRGIHPMLAKRLQLWRTANFEIERLPSVEDVYLFHGKARSNPRDERLFAFAEVRDLEPVCDSEGRVERLPRLEMMLLEALAAIREVQSHRTRRQRLHWNRVVLYLWPPLRLPPADIDRVIRNLAPATADLGVEKVVVRARIPDPDTGDLRPRILEVRGTAGQGLTLTLSDPTAEPIHPLSSYDQKVLRMRQRGLLYPYETLELLAPPSESARSPFPPGGFEEYDLDGEGRLAPVGRAPGENVANLVVGVITNRTPRHPEGMRRVILVSDPSREMGSFAEPECRRIMGAIDLAEELELPLEWIALSAGAKIAMDSGTENLDWTAAALRRMVEFTQAGGEINVVVAGINVGGQSYWNAEATMLMHTRGVLIMTDDASMVLTGKQALDYSGGVSAEDNRGIGGYDRVMGVNGQAQYWAADLEQACHILFRHYEHGYVMPGERFPRATDTRDPRDRDIRNAPHPAETGGFATVGEIFAAESNPDRKRPFDIRSVMRAVIDQDHTPLERWPDMSEAEIAVVWDAHLGGQPVCLVGFDSKPIARLGRVPTDGPESWTPGTLFPLSSKKVARAVNAASGNRPLVVVANLSGFDGSPESMRRLQLEYGAEIGRAVVNFRGPIVFCVVSRYHGGAYVVFSRTLNDNLEVAALEGSYASVIGGAPAAAVVFAREVDRRTREDPRLTELDAAIGAADEGERGRLRARWHELANDVRSEKLGAVAREFEEVHSVERAQRVGSVHEILAPERLRPYLIEAVERGMQRELARWQAERAGSRAPGT